jgi:hypothetical protein
MSDTVTVIQADREASWPHCPIAYVNDPDAKAKWMRGTYDGVAIIRAFARHRIAHEPKWLPEMIERASDSEVSNALIGMEFRACALPTPPEQTP